MARPLTGSITELADGRVRASLPVARGATKRTSAVFDRRADAQRWCDDGVIELQAGRVLPNPDGYRSDPARQVATGVAQLRTVRQAVNHWHRQHYDSLHSAQPRRSRQVLDDIANHWLPYLDAIGVIELDEVTPEVMVDFARFLGGWPLHYHELACGNDRRLAKETAARIVGTVRFFFDEMVARGRLTVNPANTMKAMRPHGGERLAPIGEPLSLKQTAELAAQLPVVHQTVLWMLRLLGLRISEAYGTRVVHLRDQGDYGLLAIEEQGGASFEERDDHGRFERVTHKATLKTSSSYRVVWVPPSLMAVLRVVVEAFHTDPATGVVDAQARLIPGIRADDAGGQEGFRAALKRAGDRVGIVDDDLSRRLHPHHMRRSVATDLKMAERFDAVFWRRFLGQVAGTGVAEQHYLLDQPEHRAMRQIAEFIDEQVREDVGSLLIPTFRTNQWGKATRTYARRDYVDTVLAIHGWQVPAHEGDDPWLSTTQVADLLGLAPSKVREQMADGRIPATQRAWGTRSVWVARRSDVEQLRRERDDRLDLNDVAAELGMSYHEAYQTLIRLEQLPSGSEPGQRLQLTQAHVAALRTEQDRIAQLHRRSMRVSDAARILPRSERTLRDYVLRGRLERDAETDSSGHVFVTRASVAALQAELTPSPRPGPVADLADAVSHARAVELTGLSRTAITTLVRTDVLATVTVNRSAYITLDSLHRWATGYRPELLEQLTALREAS